MKCFEWWRSYWAHCVMSQGGYSEGTSLIIGSVLLWRTKFRNYLMAPHKSVHVTCEMVQCKRSVCDIGLFTCLCR